MHVNPPRRGEDEDEEAEARIWRFREEWYVSRETIYRELFYKQCRIRVMNIPLPASLRDRKTTVSAVRMINNTACLRTVFFFGEAIESIFPSV